MNNRGLFSLFSSILLSFPLLLPGDSFEAEWMKGVDIHSRKIPCIGGQFTGELL